MIKGHENVQKKNNMKENIIVLEQQLEHKIRIWVFYKRKYSAFLYKAIIKGRFMLEMILHVCISLPDTCMSDIWTGAFCLSLTHGCRGGEQMRLRLFISCSECTRALCSLHLCRDVLTVYRIPAAHRVCSARTLPRSTKDSLKWNVGEFSVKSFVTDVRRSRTPYHSPEEVDEV